MKALVFATVIYATAAAAESDQRKGTEGLTRLDFRVENRGAVPISCDVNLAHWYSDHLATVAAGGTEGFTLWSDATNGAVYMMNAGGDRMPVERLWCGLDGNSWDSRHEIALPRIAGKPATAAGLICRATAQATDCDTR